MFTVHSHAGGTGKSFVTANVAALCALDGARVCIVDTDLQAPTQHVSFGLSPVDMTGSVADFIVGNCSAADTLHDRTGQVAGRGGTGALWLAPSRPSADLLQGLLATGYDAGLLDELVASIIRHLRPDLVVLDTPTGMSTETLVSLSMADSLAIVIRPDAQERSGVSLTGQMTQRLTDRDPLLVVNMSSEFADAELVRHEIEAAFGTTVTEVVPYRPIVTSSAGGVLALDHPDEPPLDNLRRLARMILAPAPPAGCG
ncbi:MAG: MinD/ParA family protein [Kineosporiaceae bacterium]